MSYGGSQRKLAIHGPIVKLDNSVPLLEEPLQMLDSEFETHRRADESAAITGIIHTYDENEVVSRLPSTASQVGRSGETDIYQDGQRFWLVDNRWGMSEIDLSQRQWRSWILSDPKLDPMHVAELAVHWPMAQLLRERGVHLLPAISAVRDGFAVLMICPFGLEPELSAMISNGFKLIGQRWTALREEDDRIALLHMPGRVEKFTTPRLRFGADDHHDGAWRDITQQHPGSRQSHAFCDAVLITDPARRGQANIRPSDTTEAVDVLQREWPIIDLDQHGRGSGLIARLAQRCRCYEVQLSRNTRDLLGMLHTARFSGPMSDGISVAA